MVYRIVFTHNAIEDLNALDTRLRATVRDAIHVHLSYEPLKQSKSRIKKLRHLSQPQYRLRVGGYGYFMT